MAHLVSTDVFKPGFQNKPVTTDAGTTLQGFTLEDVQFALHLLAYNNTKYEKTSAELDSTYGLSVHPNTLRQWVSSLFVEKYVEIQHQLAEDINKRVSARTVDIAIKAMELTDNSLDKALTRVNEDTYTANQLASIALQASTTASKSIEQSNILNEKPTQRIALENPDDALTVLKELGLLKDKPTVVDAEEVEDA